MAGARRRPAGVGDDNGIGIRRCELVFVRAPACRRNLRLGGGSEGAVEAPSDYRYARRRPQVIAPVHSTSENIAASLAGPGVVPPVSHRAADLKGQW